MGYFFSRLIDSIAIFSTVRTRVIHACFYKNKDNIERLHDGSPLTLHFRNSNLRFAGATSSKYARRFIIYNYNIYGESMIALSRYLVIVLKLISRWNPIIKKKRQCENLTDGVPVVLNDDYYYLELTFFLTRQV